ncbi:protein-glutamate O-methyltransferase CheR [Xenorhabdus szentirmaii]|uniref:Chemotaxis protein methyltransferase n=2 Tax=Xenorhabdus szentirmaii TaxID=290112 RepID=W1J3D0_9GAMM|nr:MULTISPECIES: protein-glutamate O-methyltransferase CheR [Xenorhabdus]MBD2780877.1 protein-glutamate O-methyltransferase CheR [Xenorhabdus sp. 38]MBD2792427.1 protein-glutamate O-methyltransferase CheR [Xenorhabdus sp. CUL]MBD2799697.1 protein-glutamate O-methyltransferase CheR [Xenorhabdus sp. M]MBD2803264.1 protein-glutamate O-methyltransferase CheR [Xenorhabdus sp. ZM]MBD2821578.1 protein-glutamate O-methyltransferase CheR [Xenorhabdus sp. 42]
MKSNLIASDTDATAPLNFMITRHILSDAQFERICQFIYQRAGIVLAKNKREMVYNRLVRRLRVLEINEFGQYLAILEQDSHSKEWEFFINALTTNLTAFFREAHHFPILAAHASRKNGGTYRVWSAAASTGEEPYSIAMTLCDVLGHRSNRIKIIGSDIDTSVLEKARQGVYRLEELQQLSEAQKKKYFFKGVGFFDGYARVRPLLAEMVNFQHLNLMDSDWALEGKFDAIFCRNVMIYFDKKTQERILRRFVNLLKPDGLLFAGHSENVTQISREFYLQGQTVYGVGRARRDHE